MINAKITLVQDMQFIGVADTGHAVVMDAPPSSGGKGSAAKPSELLPMAFGGCSGMDVISILRKKKQNVTKFEINVSGEMAKDYPQLYTSMHIEYVVTGKDISEDAVQRAIDLSLEKYCSVGATLGKAAKITHSYKVVRE